MLLLLLLLLEVLESVMVAFPLLGLLEVCQLVHLLC